MGLFRKITSVSTLGAVDFKSDKERAAKNTKRTAVEAKKQTRLLEQLVAHETASTADTRIESASGALPAKRTVQPQRPVANTGSLVADLRALAELRDQGIITGPEFDLQKARLLGGMKP